MNRKFLISSFLVLVAGLCGLTAFTLTDKATATRASVQSIRTYAMAPAPTPPVHFTYEGEEGPAHWGGLCKDGKSQSPIGLSGATPKDVPNIVFHYQPSKLNIQNNGHTIEVTYDAGSYIEIDGVRYNLIQFHFHAPSEHTVNGASAKAELHLVHKTADGKRAAVVGILIIGGRENPAFASTWANLPAREGGVVTVNAQVDARLMLPGSQATYRYNGSLTTPPCTEAIKWNVMVTTIEMSPSQLAKFTGLFHGGNNRPLQTRDPGRTLIVDSTP